jgi:hypothetical protein
MKLLILLSIFSISLAELTNYKEFLTFAIKNNYKSVSDYAINNGFENFNQQFEKFKVNIATVYSLISLQTYFAKHNYLLRMNSANNTPQKKRS